MLTSRESLIDPESEKLFQLCAIGDLESVKRLCFNPNIDLDICDYDKRTPLHLAASEGHKDIIELLIKNGLKNINPLDRWENTPLDDAKRGKFLDVE